MAKEIFFLKAIQYEAKCRKYMSVKIKSNKRFKKRPDRR